MLRCYPFPGAKQAVQAVKTPRRGNGNTTSIIKGSPSRAMTDLVKKTILPEAVRNRVVNLVIAEQANRRFGISLRARTVESALPENG